MLDEMGGGGGHDPLAHRRGAASWTRSPQLLGIGLLVVGLYFLGRDIFSNSRVSSSQDQAIYDLGGPILWVVMIVFGAGLIISHRRQRFAIADVDIQDIARWKSLDASTAAEVLRGLPLPFYVCTRCHIYMTPEHCMGACPRCEKIGQCLEVDDEENRSLAIASFEI